MRNRLEYMKDMSYMIERTDSQPDHVRLELKKKERYSETYFLDTADIASEAKLLEYDDAPHHDYRIRQAKVMAAIKSKYPYIQKIVLAQDKGPYVWVGYKLLPVANENLCDDVILQFNMSSMFYELLFLCDASPDETITQIATRKAPTTMQLVNNSHDYGKERYHRPFITPMQYKSIINIPLRINGKDLYGNIDEEQCMNSAVEIVNEVLNEVAILSKVLYQRCGMGQLYGNTELDMFYYDKMPPFISSVSTLPADTQKSIKYKGCSSKKISFGLSKEDQYGYIHSENEILECMELIDTDYDPYAELDAMVYYIIKWQDNTSEWACRLFAKEANSQSLFADLFDEYDRYELRGKMPTAYKSLLNGVKGLFRSGAIVETPGATFFKYEYDSDISDEKEEEICENCKKTIMKILEELSDFADYIKKKENGKNKKNSETMGNSLMRMIAYEGIRNLF